MLSEGKDKDGKYRTEPKGEQSRVAWLGGTGFGFEVESAEDADLARRMMEFTALNQKSRTKQCHQDCLSLSLAWRPGEEPTREQMEEAAHQALAALGMANARALFFAHNDEAYRHLHIVASKINPATGRAYDLKGNFLKLSKWAQQYERDFSGGIICTRREENNQMREAVGRRDAGAVLELMTQQRATFKGSDLERALAKQIKGELERAQFAEKVLSHPDAVKLADEAAGRTTRYTSRAVLEAEGQVLRAAAGLSRADRHEVSLAARQAILRRSEFEGISREQAAAFRQATEAGGIALIDGQAGTGKSFTISAIRQAYAAEGYQVIGLAPTNAVAEDMRDNGFARASTIHSELFKLNNGRTSWNGKTAIILDEAAMIDTKLMAQLTGHAHAAGAKLIMVGDDRQLSSIDRGGMFGVLKDQHGAAELSQVRRQHKNDDKRAAEHMAEGDFHTALAMYDDKGAIHWTHNQDAARAALVEQWSKDSAAAPDKSRFVFAYTNADVDRLNADIRDVRKERGELGGEDHAFQTKHGQAAFSERDRIQLTGTDKGRGLINGAAGTIEKIDGDKIAVRLDGRGEKRVEFDAKEFQDFRHGYAGTIYKGQGRTLDQTYLYHSEHWRSAASYVALTRHRDKAELFVARDTAEDVKQLSRQMARVDDRRAASHFHQLDTPVPVPEIAVRDLPQPEFPAQKAQPTATQPREWAESPGMVAQQQAAMRALRQTVHVAQTPPAAMETSKKPDESDLMAAFSKEAIAKRTAEEEARRANDPSHSQGRGGRGRTR
ncbi:MAG: AAA family ATPase [Beijerinckiaceae bacterium]